MEYLEADFKIDCQNDVLQVARDLLADAAGMAGFESFEDTPSGLKGFVQTALLDKAALDETVAHFIMPNVSIAYTMRRVEDKDWNEEWERHGFEPISIDGKIRIEDASRGENAPSASVSEPIVIRIEARQAFGTGTHETTRMMVATLLDLPLQGKRVLDCGCGTGILSLAAVKLGAEEALGYDIDEWSVSNTKHNAELNGAGNIKALHGDASIISTLDGFYDIVVANINRNILLHDMPAMTSKLKLGGLLIISGFYAEDLPLLSEKAEGLGLTLNEKKAENNWCCAVFVKC